jgi:purine-binding chemotaxis protein CheW
MPQAAVLPARTGPRRHVLTFRLDDRLYALPAGDVVEIIRVPTVARMPQSPKGLLGLANLRGAIVPIASGRSLLGQADGADASTARAIVLRGATPVALAVDEVAELVAMADSDVETELAALPGEVLLGAFRAKNGAVIKLLDIRALLSAAFVPRARMERSVRQGGAQSLAEDTQTDWPKLVAFAIAGQEYALPLDTVQEIVAAPALLATVPHSDSVVLGVTGLRDTLLPLLSLRVLLGFGPGAEPHREKVVIARLRGHRVGLVVDDMRAIFAADESRIDPIPDVLAAHSGGESRIAAIYRGQHGLVSILSADQIFGDEVMQRLTDSAGADANTTAQSETRQYLVFRLGAEEFGLPISAVEEVARVPDQIARVPNTPKFLEGVVNLRGDVVPVVDQRKRFHMPAASDLNARRLVVVRTDRHLAGLIVDSVSEVLRVEEDTIAPPPDLTGEATSLVLGVANLDSQGRIVLLLDPAELLTRAERGLLDKFSKQAPQA